MPVRMYHPKLGREITLPDDPGTIAIHVEQGWEHAPEPEARPGYEPEPVTYAPVTQPDAKARRRSTKTDPAPTGEDPDRTDLKES